MTRPFPLILTILLVSCAGGIRTGSIRVSEDSVADMGTILEKDGPATVRLLAVNDLPDTLFPVQTYTHCSCLTATSAMKAVAPGEDEIIELSYDPAYRPGVFTYEVMVYYADSPVKMRSFVVKGNVEGCTHPIQEDRPYHMGEGLYMSQKVLDFGKMRPGQTRRMLLRHGNGLGEEAFVSFDIPAELSGAVAIRQPGIMGADMRDTLNVLFTMPEGVDSIKAEIQPRVNGKATEESLKISAKRF